jgi:hypothetical protein
LTRIELIGCDASGKERKLESEELGEILSSNPFMDDGPSDYEQWLYAATTLLMGNMHALTKAVESMAKHLKDHENMHNAANQAVMDLPVVGKDEKPH